METIYINTETIALDQLLKWSGIADTGGQAKIMITEGMISLNGTVVYERRKKIHPGDCIVIKDIGEWLIKMESK